ncbi:MAG: anti-sigma factor [Cyclobacteriaceae bacterium]|nr:anti-sigma factor [Cyclobacteriaceae bacterium]
MNSFLSKFVKKFKNNAECPEKEKCLEILSLVVDGEANSEQKTYVKNHIKDCMPCNKEYEVEKAIKELLQEKCVGKAPSDLLESIKTKINQSPI